MAKKDKAIQTTQDNYLRIIDDALTNKKPLKQAIIDFGYSNSHATHLIRNNDFLTLYKKQRDKLFDEHTASGSEVRMFLTMVMRGVIKDSFNIDASLQDRLRAAELLGRSCDLFSKSKVDVSVNISEVIHRARKRSQSHSQEQE